MRSGIKGLIALAALVGTSGHTAEAGPTEAAEATGSVEIVIYQAYGDPDRLDFELSHPSGTYRKSDCERQEDRDYYGDFPVAGVWLCDDLPLGAYGLDLVGTSADEVTFGWECSDPSGFGYLPLAMAPTIGLVEDHPTLGLEWSCSIVSSVPGVHARGVLAAPFAFVDAIELGVAGPSGQLVEGCESLVASDWCPIELRGDYRVVYSGIPDGFEQRDACRAVSQSEVHSNTPSGESAAITDAWPLWACERELWAPMEFHVEGNELDPASIDYELTDSDGQPVDGCRWMDLSDAGGAGPAVLGVCLGLEDGTYRFTASHPSVPIEARCERGDPNQVVIPAIDDPTQNVPARCEIREVPDAPTSTSVPNPAVLLPPTGPSVNAAGAVAALLLLAAGVALTGLSGGWRRSSAGRS